MKMTRAVSAALLSAILFYLSPPAYAKSSPSTVAEVLAQAYGFEQVPVSRWNQAGTFWRILEGRMLVPEPGAPVGTVFRAYSLGDGESFLVDEFTPVTSSVDFTRLQRDIDWLLGAIAERQEKKTSTQTTVLSASTQIASLDDGMFSIEMMYGPNDLWLEILRLDLPSRYADLRLYGTEEGRNYQLLSTNSLGGNGEWVLGDIAYGEYGTNKADFHNVYLGTNSQMFFRAHQADATIGVYTSQDPAVEPNGNDPGNWGVFTVYASGALASDLTACYRISGTASNGVDYTNLTGVVTIPASSGYAEIDVQPIQDGTIEGPETIVLTLQQTNSYLIEPSASSATVNLADTAATVSLVLSQYPAYETNGPPGIAAQSAIFTFYRSDARGTLTNRLTVFYQISGTASNGVDYSALSGSLTFLEGDSYTNLEINPWADTIIEGIETVTLILIPTNTYYVDSNAPSASTELKDSSTTVSISTYYPIVAIEPNGPPGMPALPAAFQVTRQDDRGEFHDMDVSYRVSGTASNGLDYILTGVLHFVGDIQTTNLDVTPLGDNFLEGPESVTVTLIATNGYYVDTNHAFASVTIIDSSTTISIGVSSPGYAYEQDGPPSVPASTNFFQFSRTDTKVPAQYPEMDVFYRVSGTASNGVDYFLSGVLHFATNIVSTNLNVVPFADGIIEGPETVTVTLIPTNGYYLNPIANSNTMTIWDSSTTVSIVLSNSPAIETNGPTTVPAQPGRFRISRTDSRSRYLDLDVYYALSGTAINGQDYSLSGVIRLAAGILSTNLEVLPFTDNIFENSETVTATLIATNGYYVSSNTAAATLEIKDSSTTLTAYAGFDATEPNPATGLGGLQGSFYITRADSRYQFPDLVVYYQISGTAGNGIDYTNLSGSFIFPANQSSTNIPVYAMADNLVEGDETVMMTLIASNGYYVNTNSPSQTLIIHDAAAFIPVLSIHAPVGIDYHAPSNSLIVSYNYASSGGGGPFNFGRIYTEIAQSNSMFVTNVVATNWSNVTGLDNEVTLATVKITQSGFTNGDLYFASNGIPGCVGWLSSDASVSNLIVNVLTNDTQIHGGFYVDQTGVFSNNLIVVTGNGGSDGGGVWMIDSAHNARRITTLINTHLEGVVTLPNDTNKWGPWAGKIITGCEDTHSIFAIATNGAVATNFLGIDPEDFDIIWASPGLMDTLGAVR